MVQLTDREMDFVRRLAFRRSSSLSSTLRSLLQDHPDLKQALERDEEQDRKGA
tara:strand:- start:130 stop:288 length:159 start_codon:yes stop_codon:yes gene_type:complete